MAFQFTLPHGERRGANHPALLLDGFNSRSRMGSDSRSGGPCGGGCGFNSRSRMGSDQQVAVKAQLGGGFNSRSRMGSDEQAVLNKEIYARFNSRSRMGSDRLFASLPARVRGFNSRSRMGSDLQSRIRRNDTEMFQFTLPHGERQHKAGSSPTVIRFQFTLPHGERPAPVVDLPLATPVSIHAPAWGATCFHLRSFV